MNNVLDEKNELFAKAPIPKAVATLAIPTVLSMLVTVIYNMADTYFVGQTNDPNQVAAVSLTMPVFLVLMAFGNIFGMGGSSLIARSLGSGQTQKVKNISSFCFYGALVVGIFVAIGFIAGMNPILKVVGASENTWTFTRDYLFWIGIGAPIVIISNAFSNIVRSEGAAKTAMIGMMIGTITNIILDPIMILSMNMGVKGAAIATVIGNIASIIFYILYIEKGKSILSLSPLNFSMKHGIFSGVVSIGMPASINSVLMSAANILLNNLLVLYGDIPVAAMGVALKANMLVVMLQIGISMGVQPLIGYNYGSGDYHRMRGIMKFSMLCNIVIGSLLTAVYFFTADGIINAFISDPDVIANGVNMLRALMISGPVLGIMFVYMSSFQAMGKAIPSLVLSISRQGFIFIPILVISNRLFKLDGIIYAQPIADIFSIILAFVIFLFVNKSLKKQHSSQ